MKWFLETFIPSLEERYKNRKNSKPIWLTAKQTSICKRYMNPSNAVRGTYTLEVGENTYCIQSAPNGCAAFSILKNGWII